MIYIVVALSFLYLANIINIMPVVSNALSRHPDDELYIRVPNIYRIMLEAEDRPVVVAAAFSMACLLMFVSRGHPAPWLFYPEIAGLMLESVVITMSLRGAIYLDYIAAKFPKINILSTAACKVLTAGGLLTAYPHLPY